MSALRFQFFCRRFYASYFASASLLRVVFFVSCVPLCVLSPPLCGALLAPLSPPFRVYSAALTLAFVHALLALAFSQSFLFDCVLTVRNLAGAPELYSTRDGSLVAS